MITLAESDWVGRVTLVESDWAGRVTLAESDWDGRVTLADSENTSAESPWPNPRISSPIYHGRI